MNNTSGVELYTEIRQLIESLKKAHKEMEQYGLEADETEMRFNIEYSKALLQDTNPVSIREKVVKGKEDIALFEFEMNRKTHQYKDADKKIDSIKKSIGVLEKFYDKEWYKND